jgi:hypothetical protein
MLQTLHQLDVFWLAPVALQPLRLPEGVLFAAVTLGLSPFPHLHWPASVAETLVCAQKPEIPDLLEALLAFWAMTIGLLFRAAGLCATLGKPLGLKIQEICRNHEAHTH